METKSQDVVNKLLEPVKKGVLKNVAGNVRAIIIPCLVSYVYAAQRKGLTPTEDQLSELTLDALVSDNAAKFIKARVEALKETQVQTELGLEQPTPKRKKRGSEVDLITPKNQAEMAATGGQKVIESKSPSEETKVVRKTEAEKPAPATVPVVAPRQVRPASLADILGGSAIVSTKRIVPEQWRGTYQELTTLRATRFDAVCAARDEYRESLGDGAVAEETEMAALSQLRMERVRNIEYLEGEMKEVDAAIQRIHNGSYGICEETGEPIEAERLKAYPATRYSTKGELLVKQRLEAERLRIRLEADEPVDMEHDGEDKESEEGEKPEKENDDTKSKKPEHDDEDDPELADKDRAAIDEEDDDLDPDDQREAVERGFDGGH